MDESLKQQILAVELLRPHSIYFSNCSYLLRQKKKKKKKKERKNISKHNFVITQLLALSLPFASLGWGSGRLRARHGARQPAAPTLLGLWLAQGEVLVAGWWAF